MENSEAPSKSRVVGFIDIGTNSIRLLLVRINPNKTYQVLTAQKEVVRLGEGEFIEQTLQPEAMDRAITVCRKFAELARQRQAEEIIAVATSATREASNKGEFIQRLKDEAGLDVRAISGLEEARLIYLGVASGVHLADRQALFIDIGGGSTEIIVGDQQQYHLLDSLKLGAIRLTTMFFLPDEQEPISPIRYALIQNYVRNIIVRTIQRVQPYKIDVVYGSSGTILNLADIAASRFFKRKLEREDEITHAQLKEVIQVLCEANLEERRQIPGINPDRADIIIAGAAIIDTIMEELKLPSFRPSERGLRDGLLIDYLSRTDQSLMLGQMTVRERSVLHLARTVNFDEPHARHVARLALQLYDSGYQIGLHRLGRWERELLEYAALLHDIGAFLSYQNHQMHTYYLIRNADLLGFDQKEIAIMALASLHHRKALPSKKEPEFAALDKDSQTAVKVLGIILRLAESLDRSHMGAVHRARFVSGEKKEVILEMFSDQDCQLEQWGVENHLEAFEKTFNRPLVVRVIAKSTV